MSRNIAVFGSTGSVGTSTLDVVARHPDRFRVLALAAGSREEPLVEQCRQFRPAVVVMADAAAADRLRGRLADEGIDGIQVQAGVEAMEAVAGDPAVDQVMAAVVGAAGLRPALAAARAGKRVLLANKESLVMAGALFMEAVREGGAELLPIDSEHNAIFQCLPDGRPDLDAAGVERILLTASGGPFRDRDPAHLAAVTPDEACAHPNWDMGRKISVDSATMMNKGLEVIEACWLFGAGPDRVEVVIHPESIVHSMVSYRDGAVMAELGNPDMRTPIAHALGWPDRVSAGVEPLDLVASGALHFQAPDPERFPCLPLAYRAIREGGTAPALLNAANEVAVAAFLDGGLDFLGIARVIAATLDRVEAEPARDLATILAADERARATAMQLLPGSEGP
ncbi:1-deoxy-D-xylulose-5-phosphate reductoisomerase [Thiohalospira sp.]|uniref:1-deoxy-D-xylulose-5-phosphate reductoisomerase n=1 Tax=Thiohalospira sp. TaxID=3080549 RepID=UPI00397F42A6